MAQAGFRFTQVWFRQVFGLLRVWFRQIFGLLRVWFRQVFGLLRVLVYSGFGLGRFLVYSGFGLDRFHCIYIYSILLIIILGSRNSLLGPEKTWSDFVCSLETM